MERVQFPRHYIFVLQDGRTVVRLSDGKALDINAGVMTPYEQHEYSHAITDGELRRLMAADLVAGYDTHHVVFTHPVHMPASGATGASSRVQGYYIATGLPASQFDNVMNLLPHLAVSHIIRPVLRNGVVAIDDGNGHCFRTLHDAEDILQQLVQVAPDLFTQSFISMFEVSVEDNADVGVPGAGMTYSTPHQGHLSGGKGLTRDKLAVLVGRQDEALWAPAYQLLEDIFEMDLRLCESATDALLTIEDTQPALVLLDLNLPDIHGWAFIKKLREIPHLANLPVIVISDDANDMLLALKIVKVSAFLHYPIDLNQLREKILATLRDADSVPNGS